MRRAFAWLTGIVGVAALAKILQRRRRELASAEPAGDPAEELRETLARARESEPAEPTAGDPKPPASPDERRSQVYERAQETIGRMRSSGDAEQ